MQAISIKEADKNNRMILIAAANPRPRLSTSLESGLVFDYQETQKVQHSPHLEELPYKAVETTKYSPAPISTGVVSAGVAQI